MKGLAPRIALAAGSLALAFLGVEAGLRLARFDPLERALSGRVELVRASADPVRVYELVPGARGSGWGTEVVINSHGFRGPEVDAAAPGRERLVALGDSITFGNDLPFEATWPAVLQRALATPGHVPEVLNLGLGGYDTQQEVATLAALGLAFRPVHVVLGFCVNDLGVVSMSMETPFVPGDRENPLYTSRILQWLHARGMERAQQRALFERNREATYARVFAPEIEPLARDFAARVELFRAQVAQAPPADQDLATRRIPARWFASEARLGRLAHAFGRLAELGDLHGFGVTVLLVPYLEEDPLILAGLEFVRALAEARGFEVVDPRAAYVAEGLAELRIRAEDPIHPNARGHELLAHALAAGLRSRLAERARAEE